MFTLPRLLALAALAASAALASPYDVAPLAPAPTLDGRPAEWTSLPALALSGDRGPASVRLAHDSTHFYAFVEVADPSPLRNSAAQPQEMLKGGDAVALYFNHPDTGPQRVILGKLEGETLIYVHRPRSEVKQPHVFSSPVGSVAFDYVGPLADARAAFHTTREGYSAEIALPWSSLGFRSPPAAFGFDLQVIYSDPAGSHNVGFAWLHATNSPGHTVEDLPSEAALYPDTWGRAVLADGVARAGSAPLPSAPQAPAPAAGETIVLDLPREGRLTVNILDRDGWILRELVLAEKKKAGRHEIRWDGRDRYGDLLPPGDYRWKAILFDGMGTRFAGSVGNSARPPFRTADGRGSLGGQHGPQGVVAADSGGVYIGGGLQEGEPSFRKIDPKTGVSLWKRGPGGFQGVIAVAADEGFTALISTKGRNPHRTAALALVNPDSGSTLRIGSRTEIDLDDIPSGRPEVPGLVIAGGRAIYSNTAAKNLGVIRLADGQRLPSIPLDASGLARLDEHTLLACVGTSIVRLDLRTGATTPVVTGLAAPRAIAVEPGTGNVFVSDLGDSQQIKKFTRDGKPLATFGPAGGKPRSMPVYDPMAFREVTGLAFAADGTLWMKETHHTPKRFVRITADGKWIEDFCGPVAYNVFGPDLDDVSTIYYNPSPKTSSVFIETRVDYAGYAADPARPGNWKITALHDLALGADGESANPLLEEVAKNGYGHVIAFKAEGGRRFLFRLSKFNRASAPDGAGLWVWEKDRWLPFAFLSADEKRGGLSWRDLNGDGLVQENERFAPAAYDRFAWIDRDLSLHGTQGRHRPAKIDAAGLPVFADGTFTPYAAPGEPALQGSNVFVSHQRDGAVYYAINHGPHRHNSFWDRATENRVVKIADGKVQWITGRNDPRDHFTSFSTMSGIAGVVDDILLVHNVEPSTFIGYTTDGMLLGNVAADPDGSKPGVGGTAIYIEHFTGLFLKDEPTGRRLLFYVVSGDDRVVEVTGPGRVERFEGALSLAAASRPSASRIAIPYAKIFAGNARGLGIDGEDTEWNPSIPRHTLSDAGAPVADLRLRRDGGALHVIADILSPAPLQAGEGLDIAFARSEQAPPVVISLRADGKKPGPRSTWSGTATITRGGKSEKAPGIEIATTRRWRDLGYRIEASIPLSLLPEFTEPVSQTFRRANATAPQSRTGTTGDVTEILPDLRAPLFGNLRVIRVIGGEPTTARLAPTGLVPTDLQAAP